jgi:hypothetical protein
MGQRVERQLQDEFIKRTNEIRLRPHPRPSISTLVYPVDGSEPMVLCRRRMMTRFLLHRVMFVQQLRLPPELHWTIIAFIYTGDVEDIILDVKRPPLVTASQEEEETD